MNREFQLETLKEFHNKMLHTLINKGDDYAKEDRLSNFKEVASSCNISSQQACLALIATKVSRLGSLYSSGKPPKNESIQDSILDLANYAALLYMIEVEDAKSKTNPEYLAGIKSTGSSENTLPVYAH